MGGAPCGGRHLRALRGGARARARCARCDLQHGPMKILMTADTVGGVERYATDLAAAIDGEVVLATFGARRGPHFHLDLKLEWMDEPWADLADAEEWLLEL